MFSLAMNNSRWRQSKAFDKSVSKKPKAFPFWTDFFRFSSITKSHCRVPKLFRKPHWYFENILLKNWYICVRIDFWNIFDKYICEFRIFGNFFDFIELLKPAQKKSSKISMFSFTIFKGISELEDNFNKFISWLKIKCSTSSLSTSVKLERALISNGYNNWVISIF